MNPEDYSRTDLIASGIGWGWLAAGALALAAIWLLSLKLRARFESRVIRFWFLVVGSVIATTGLWMTFQALSRFFALATPWSLWFLAALGGIAAEIIVWLYRLEKTLVNPLSRGRWLLGLRLGALAILIIILLQPVRSLLLEREINREVAVLIDQSESMQLADQRLTPSEALDRAQLFEVEAVTDGRPKIFHLNHRLTVLRDRVAAEEAGLDSAPDLAAAVESRKEILGEFVLEVTDGTAAAAGSVDSILKKNTQLPGNVRNQLSDFLNQLTNQAGGAFEQAAVQLEANNAQGFRDQLNAARQVFESITPRLSALTEESDGAFFNQLTDAERSLVTGAATRPRAEITRELLSKPLLGADLTEEGAKAGQTLLDRLGDRYNLRFYQFARDPEEIAKIEDYLTEPAPEEGTGSETDLAAASLTDLTGALDHILENSSPESLAGVLLLSDGRHNAATLPEDALRQLGVQNSPLSSVPIGGRVGPVDASVLSLTAPESIYLGDRIVVKSEIKLDGLRGQKVKSILRHNGEIVDEQIIEVPDVNYRTELRFVHLPEDKGIFDYQLELEPIESELFSTNNFWDFKVAVTDDRTNVLLVDGYPRWEFRYLRNLFYGRDKSVHLQYVLMRPDRIDGMRNLDGVAASATRKFGDAEAESLPRDEDEWRLFDVIILGDIPPASLGPAEWRYIAEAVTRRGALLICIAGPRYMPHAHNNETIRDLLPVTYDHSDEENFGAPEREYRLTLTNAGRGHPVMAQSSSRALNLQLWGNMPNLRWRTLSTGVKEGAEVLAYAQPVGTDDLGSNAVSLDGSPESVEEAIRQLANRKTIEQERALVTIQRAGLGKVAMLNFDRTWRFRYGVGDTYHHRFWGQLLRWGAGENLRSGGERVRLGTDRLTYTPSDTISIVSKVFDTDRRPVTDAEVFAAVYDKSGNRQLLRQKMSYRTGSSGIYETTVTGLSNPGEYTVKLEGAAVSDVAEPVETELLVVATRNPIELAELTADRDFLNRAAQLTGGKVTEIPDAYSLVDAFGAPKETLTERRNITLWDKWPLLVLFLGLLTTEWVVRRRSGLA